MDSPQDALPETEGAPHLLGGDLYRVHGRRDKGVAEADEHAAQVQLVHPRRLRACYPGEDVGEARGEQDRLGPDQLLQAPAGHADERRGQVVQAHDPRLLVGRDGQLGALLGELRRQDGGEARVHAVRELKQEDGDEGEQL